MDCRKFRAMPAHRDTAATKVTTAGGHCQAGGKAASYMNKAVFPSDFGKHRFLLERSVGCTSPWPQSPHPFFFAFSSIKCKWSVNLSKSKTILVFCSISKSPALETLENGLMAPALPFGLFKIRCSIRPCAHLQQSVQLGPAFGALGNPLRSLSGFE
jgi:hypothetical protein